MAELFLSAAYDCIRCFGKPASFICRVYRQYCFWRHYQFHLVEPEWYSNDCHFLPIWARFKIQKFYRRRYGAWVMSSIEALNDNDYILAANVNANLGNGAGAVNYASARLDQTYNAGLEGIPTNSRNFNTRSWGTYVGGMEMTRWMTCAGLVMATWIVCRFCNKCQCFMTIYQTNGFHCQQEYTTATSDGIDGLFDHCKRIRFQHAKAKWWQQQR